MPGGFFRDLARAANDTCNQVMAEADALFGRRYPPQGGWYEPHGHYGQQQYYQQPPHPQYYQQQPPPPPYTTYGPHSENHHNGSQHGQWGSYGFGSRQQYHHRSNSNNQQAQYAPSGFHGTAFSLTSPPAPMGRAGGLFSFQPDTPGGCNPLLTLTTAYYTASVPGLAVCPQCYNTLVAQTCYASLFRSEHYPQGSQVSCDLGIHTLKVAWNQTVSRGMAAASSNQEQQVWLSQFNQHVQETRTRLQTISAEIAAVAQNTQTSAMQTELQKMNAALRLGSQAAQMSPTTRYIYRETGNQGIFGTSQPSTDLFRNQMHLSRLSEQLKSIFGPGIRVN